MVAMAWAGWDRLRASQDERRACAIERQRPVRRLETRRGMRLKRRGGRFPAAVVAVLVLLPEMEHRVRRALGGRATLRLASTWGELQQVVADKIGRASCRERV